MYQQRPSPEKGSIFKRASLARFWRMLPSPAAWDRCVQSWDMAFKDEDDSDWVVGQLWVSLGADRYLVDQVRDRMSFADTIVAVEAFSAKWPQASAKYVEDAANGPAVISTLRSRIGGLIPVPAMGSKAARAHAVSAEFEAGNVHLPEPARTPWLSDYIEELALFPQGDNDDQVDATTQALLQLGSGFGGWTGSYSVSTGRR